MLGEQYTRFIQKPYDPSVLLGMIRDMLKES
jgi:hypothetical protein